MRENIKEALAALTEKPVFSTTFERIRILGECGRSGVFSALPQPKRFAATLRYLLERVSLPVSENDLIIGRVPDRTLNDEEEKQFQEFIHGPLNTYRNATFLGSGHSSYDWEELTELGLPGLREKAKERLERENMPDKRAFLEGMIGVYDAMLIYTSRWAEAAMEKGLRMQADALKALCAGAPSTFYEALELCWIVTLVECAYITDNPTLTLGRMDRFLYPFYIRDLESKKLTRESAKEMIIDYYCKHNLIMGRGEHQLGDAENSTTFERILNFDAPQYLMIAGTDENGRDAVNDLTLLFAECVEPGFKNPVIVVRYFIGMDAQEPELWKILTEKAVQSASMMFYNDNNVISAYKRMGLDDDCKNYLFFGCNWPSPGTNATWMHAGPPSWVFCPDMDENERHELMYPNIWGGSKEGWPGVFNEVMNSLASSGREDVTIDDFYDMFFARWRAFVKSRAEYYSHELYARQRNPSSLMNFTDCFSAESRENAKCHAASSKYHFMPVSVAMFGTVADCFTTVDELVFRRKKVTLRELCDAVNSDYKDNERLRLLCLSVEKYGSDSELSDYHTNRIAKLLSDIVFEESRPYYEKQKLFLEPTLQSDTWHLKIGRISGATPDGRHAGQAYSQNSRPVNGVCTNGLTGMFSSMLNIPAGAFMSGALNLDIDKGQFLGEEGREKFAGMLAAYFNGGGLHAQVSCVSREDLINAQSEPEKYRDLRVRVTGYSGIFVDLCTALQNDIIDRFRK